MKHGETFYSALEGVTFEEVEPLAKALGVDISYQHDEFIGQRLRTRLWEEFSYLGSHDIAYALRGFEGVDYPEIVRDVCSRAKVDNVRDENTLEAVESNELGLIKKLITDMWEKMNDTERRALLESLNIEMGRSLPYESITLLLSQILGRFAGFAAYQTTVIVANVVAQTVLGRGLSFAANTLLTRTLGMALGPVGWAVSGSLLVGQLSSPAYRKTVPGVVQVAALRQLLKNRDVIGVVGRGSVGKDSLLHHAFGIDKKNLHIGDVPGSTSEAKVYSLPCEPRVRILNFPGFGDLRSEVNSITMDQLKNCHLMIYMIDASQFVQEEELLRFKKAQVTQGSKGEHLEVIFNRCDRIEDGKWETMVNENIKILGLKSPPVLMSLYVSRTEEKDPLLEPSVLEIQDRIDKWLITEREKPPVFKPPNSLKE